MANVDLPNDIAEFLARHIESVVHLEVLLSVFSRAGEVRTAKDVAGELRIDPAWTDAALSSLASGGVLEKAESGYRFPAGSGPMSLTVAALAKLYDERRVTVISMIFSKPQDPIRRFTDAFRFRTDEGG